MNTADFVGRVFFFFLFFFWFSVLSVAVFLLICVLNEIFANVDHF